ncbi:Uncharacterised protein [uncultured archaeon]|nr:Uncharacterised protein [uncultured archaeon]
MGRLNRLMAICKALILVSMFASTACANVDVDYSHNVAGNGTVITDYMMGDQETSVATGAIRGTGNVFNSYSFSTNNSSDFRIEDRFVLTKTTERAVTMSVVPSFPPWPGKPGSFKLIGKSWAENIEIGPHNSSQNHNSPHAGSLESSGSEEGISNNEGSGEFKFSGAAQEGTAA